MERKEKDVLFFLGKGRESPRGVVANVLDCDIIVSEFELQMRAITFIFEYSRERHEPLAIS